MTVQERIYGLLKNGVPSVAGRVYPMTALQNPTFPYLVYFMVSESPRSTFDTARIELHERQIQISLFAKDYLRGAQIANDEVIPSLVGFTEPKGMQSCFLTGLRDLWDDETKTFHTAIDMTCQEDF